MDGLMNDTHNPTNNQVYRTPCLQTICLFTEPTRGVQLILTQISKMPTAPTLGPPHPGSVHRRGFQAPTGMTWVMGLRPPPSLFSTVPAGPISPVSHMNVRPVSHPQKSRYPFYGVHAGSLSLEESWHIHWING